jgi:hypothetical protein
MNSLQLFKADFLYKRLLHHLPGNDIISRTPTDSPRRKKQRSDGDDNGASDGSLPPRRSRQDVLQRGRGGGGVQAHRT